LRTIGLLVGMTVHVELVDLVELGRLGVGGAGHARQLLVHAEEVLVGHRGDGLVLLLDVDALLGLDRLVQAVGPPPPRHLAAGELVDDDDLALLDEVVDVALVQRVGAQRLADVVVEVEVLDVVEVVDPEQLLDALDALVGEHRRVGLLVDGVVDLALEARDHLVDPAVPVGRVLGAAGDDERRAGLVDEDRVDLVDHRVVERALDHAVGRLLHVVAQVVEAELAVLAVGDVAVVRALALEVVEAVDDDPGRQAEEAVQLAHPLGVAAGQVVVDRDQVRALAGQRVQEQRQRGDQRLAFAGAHLGDAAGVQHHAADQLHVVVAHVERPPAALADQREGVDEDVVERRAVVELLLEVAGLGLELGVRQRLHLRLELADLHHLGLELLDLALVPTTEDLLEESHGASDRVRPGDWPGPRRRVLAQPNTRKLTIPAARSTAQCQEVRGPSPSGRDRASWGEARSRLCPTSPMNLGGSRNAVCHLPPPGLGDEPPGTQGTHARRNDRTNATESPRRSKRVSAVPMTRPPPSLSCPGSSVQVRSGSSQRMSFCPAKL
jgi:hypothetical protein